MLRRGRQQKLSILESNMEGREVIQLFIFLTRLLLKVPHFQSVFSLNICIKMNWGRALKQVPAGDSWR